MGEHALGRRLNPWLYQNNGEISVAQSNAGGGLVQVAPAALLRISAAAARIRQELGVAGRQADDTTIEAAQGLTRENFDLGPALKAASDLWHSQVTTLHQACHKIQQNLEANASLDTAKDCTSGLAWLSGVVKQPAPRVGPVARCGAPPVPAPRLTIGNRQAACGGLFCLWREGPGAFDGYLRAFGLSPLLATRTRMAIGDG